MRLIGISLLLGLAACDMGHLGNPQAWPAAAVGVGIENTTYGVRRARVSDYVAAHHGAILADIAAGTGPALNMAADLARVPFAKRPALIQTLQTDRAKFTPDTPEARERLVIWLMVHGP